MKFIISILLLFYFTVQAITAQGVDNKNNKDNFSSSTFEGLKFRSIGPAVTEGRLADIAVDSVHPGTIYIASASGGVWKSTDYGTTWDPIFDKESSYSIGCITIDPNNPFVIWVGSGENNSQRSVSYGDGVYRSDDGGATWKNMGLKSSEHIGKILVDPRNSNIIFVAAQGPLWNAGGDRGLYKSTDGGKNWKAVLSISKYTGVNDVIFDPRNPDVMYASSYQRMRHVYTLIDGGPESAIYKSTDGGENWEKLTNGIPKVDLGRIGLGNSPANQDIVYAIIEAADNKGGFFKSTDRGASWIKTSDYMTSSPQYYNEIVVDPKDVNIIYVMDTFLQVSTDGGKTFKGLGEKYKHVDNHAMWIDPKNSNHFFVGCDGGLYESWDRGVTWQFNANLPVTQFYRVTVDNAKPFYFVYGGSQDNLSLGGPSQTINAAGIVNSDWFATNSGDGFVSQVDPENPGIVYAEAQYGALVRFNKKTGELTGIQPQEGANETPLRWNWDSPLIISPHSHTTLYFAANKIFKSTDMGNSWIEVSPDLTRQIDRNKLPVMGKIWSVDAVSKSASTSFYGNIVSLAESPVKTGLLYAGTDDGLINISENDGGSWKKYDSFSNVPDTSYVSSITPSQFDVNVVYATFDNHKRGDFKPYVLKSVDQGKSWKSISSNLPDNGYAHKIAEDFKDPDLLFVGTEFGVFFTVDGGKKWVQLKGGLPTIAVRDIAIQKRESDLVLATFGRGFYIIDNYSPLRFITPDTLEKNNSILFPVKNASMFIKSQPFGYGGKGFMGGNYFTAPNPSFGATFTYYLKETIKTKKGIRQEEEKKAVKEGEKIKYPTYDELKAEDNELPPYLLFKIYDGSGNEVYEMKAPPKAGIHRIYWNLRYPSTYPTRIKPHEVGEFSIPEEGFLALPGKYSVKIYKSVNGVQTELSGSQSFNAVVLGTSELNETDMKELVDFQDKVAELNRVVMGAEKTVDELENKVEFVKAALLQTPKAPGNLMSDADSILSEIKNIKTKLTGDQTLSGRNQPAPISIIGRVQGIIYDEWQSTASPTKTNMDAYKIVSDEITPVLLQLKNLVNDKMKNLQNELERAGAPWIPGNVPEWHNK
jgi:photosystem II stability/assembly factor-like uncharacterized protein